MDNPNRIEEQRCQGCGYRMDTVSSPATGRNAQPGDPVLCMKCGLITTLENGQLRPLTVFEARQIRANPQLMHEIREALRGIEIIWAARN